MVMQTYFIYLWQGIGGLVVTMLSLVVCGWLVGLNVLLAINIYRWLALRVKREMRKPEKDILKPSIVWTVFEKGLTVPPKAVKNGKKGEKANAG